MSDVSARKGLAHLGQMLPVEAPMPPRENSAGPPASSLAPTPGRPPEPTRARVIAAATCAVCGWQGPRAEREVNLCSQHGRLSCGRCYQSGAC